MQLVTEAALPFVPATSTAFDDDPFSFITAARKEHPWLARMEEGGYVVHGYQAVKDLSAMDDKCGPLFADIVDIYEAKGTPWGDWMSTHLLALHGPDHIRIKSSIAHAFTPAAANRFRNRMRERMSELLDEWAPKGEFDFHEFVTNYPITVLCAVLGVGTEELPLIHGFLEAQGQSLSLKKERFPEIVAGFDVMVKYVDKLVKEREKAGPSGEKTLLDALIDTKNSGQISEYELRSILMVLFPGGYDTSRNTLSLIAHTLIQYPDYWKRCGEDKDFCAKVVEEMFRYTSVAPPVRAVLEDFVYDGILLPKGTRLFLCNPFTGRDPTAFENADKFDPERVSENRHVAFGRGSHMCPGQHLARTQVIEALHLITQRLKNPRLNGEVKWRAFLGVWGPDKLPIKFDPEPARATH